MYLFEPKYYNTVHLVIIMLMTLFCCFGLQHKTGLVLIQKQRNTIWTLLYALLFIIVVGLRPVDGVFGDTVNYATTYNKFIGTYFNPEGGHDILFYSFMWWCAQIMPVEYFFLIVEVLYIVPMILACMRLMKKNYDLAILFCFAAFSFFTYGVNGIRNGMACSLVTLALTYLNGNLGNKIVCALLAFLAVNIHGSTALPILCMVVAYYIRSPRFMFVFWAFSIFLSLVAGGSISNLFTQLGFDERLSDYILTDVDEDLFSRTGFRWDFLLYSSIPVLFGYYILFKKKVFDFNYLLLLGTYIYANSFWIMVIRAEYSNRFAYLSWFLYPIVLAYPLLKLEIWSKTQGRKLSFIMIGHLAFTLFMTFVYG